MFLLETEESQGSSWQLLEEKLAISEQGLKGKQSEIREHPHQSMTALEEKIGGLDGQIDSERARNQ